MHSRILPPLVGLAVLAFAPFAEAQRHYKFTRNFGVKIKPHTSSMIVREDRNGNIFLVGFTAEEIGAHPSTDWFVAKFSPAGVRLWYRTFNGRGNGFDQPNDAAVDRLGNIVVCGYTTGLPQEGSSAAIVKWDTNGNRKWVRYSPGNTLIQGEYDDFRAMKIDYLNNIYVTGTKTVSPVAGVDMVVEKYSEAGLPLWSRTWDGGQGANASEMGLSLDLHPNGMVYVGGTASKGNEVCGGFWVVTAQGAIHKFVRYDGNGSQGGNVSNVVYRGGRVHVFGSIRGTRLESGGNEGTIISDVYTPYGGLLLRRLFPGNASIDRSSRTGAVGSDGSFFNFSNTFLMNQGKGIAQMARYSPSGVLGGFTTLQPPGFAQSHGGFFIAVGVMHMFYSTFTSGSNRIYSVPVLNGLAQTAVSNVLNLAGQTFDPPVVLDSGALALPTTQNGIAGVRWHEPVAQVTVKREVKKGEKFAIRLEDGSIIAGTRTYRIQIWASNSMVPVETVTKVLGASDTSTQFEVQFPTVNAGETLSIDVCEVDSQGNPAGLASRTVTYVVP